MVGPLLAVLLFLKRIFDFTMEILYLCLFLVLEVVNLHFIGALYRNGTK